MKTIVHIGLALAIAAGTACADSLALVAADSAMNEQAAQAALMATGKFTAVDIYDTQTSLPSLATLNSYTHVLAWTSAAANDPVGMGNLLADFYDLGGKHLTVATFAFSTIPPVPPMNFPDPELKGRVMSAPYAAFTNVGVNGDLSGSLVAAAGADPIFSGIDLTQILYAHNPSFAHPGMATGATLLAADGTGPTAVAMIARSQNGVINVNFYPGGAQGNTAGNNNQALFNLITNTFPAAQTVKDTVPPTTTSSVQPAPNAQGWNNSNITVTLTASDNAGGSGVKQISLTLTGAQTGSSVVTGNSAPISITTEGSTTVTYFSTDNAGNVESAKTLTVLLDKTPPAVTATASPLPDAQGNYTAPVTVTFTATDTLSGVASCTLPITLSASGTAKGTCTDNAGNSASVSKSITVASASSTGGNTSGGSGSGTGAAPLIAGVPATGKCVLHPAFGELVHAATLFVNPTQTATFDVTASSSEPAAQGKTDIVIDGTGLHPHLIRLRAENSVKGSDRVYTIHASATSKSGQSTAVTFTCTVAQYQGGGHDGDNDHDDGNSGGGNSPNGGTSQGGNAHDSGGTSHDGGNWQDGGHH